MENLETPIARQLPLPPENWIRKTKHGKTKMTEEKKNVYVRAWVDVKNGTKTIYGAAKSYNLTFSTLWSWCQRENITEVQPTPGRPSFLNKDLEKKIESFVLESQRTGFPVTSSQVIDQARAYNFEHDIVEGWIPGPKWCYGFMKRHNISFRTAESISSKGFNISEMEIRQWFGNVIVFCLF